MFADQVVEVRVRVWSDMPVRARGTEWTVTLQVSFTCWAIGRDTVAIGLEKERREGEGILRRSMVKDLPAEVGRARTQGQYLGLCGHIEMIVYPFAYLFVSRGRGEGYVDRDEV
jgi:hypothetical protein